MGQPLTLSSDPGDAAESVVYRADATGPQTHVLILGVGSYPWSELAELSSPAVSARAIADWFLGFSTTRFSNTHCPLGSLAILLSDAATDKDGAKAAADVKAEYRGLPTLRPRLKECRAAAEAWRKRLRAHPGNMAVVYACGHGLSDFGHTGFILEDYGSDESNTFTGLVDVDDFIKAAATLPAKAQMLFFDCCRNKIETGIQPGMQLGDRLIDPAGRRSPDVGQIALFATGLDAVAAGRRNKTSLFAASLLNALDLGATKRAGKWVVRPGSLYDTLADSLSLYGQSTDIVQRPGGVLSASSFPINFPTFSQGVRCFVSFADRDRWRDSEVTISSSTAAGTPAVTIIKGDDTGALFYEGVLQLSVEVAFSAKVGSDRFRIESAPVEAPAMWARFDDTLAVDVTTVEGAVSRGVAKSYYHSRDSSSSRTGGAGGEDGFRNESASLDIRIGESSPFSTEGAVVTIEALDDDDQQLGHFVLPIGVRASKMKVPGTVPPGRYRVDAILPDGRKLARAIKLKPGETQTLTFTIGPPPRDFLGSAFVAGVLPLSALRQDDGWESADVAVRSVAPPHPGPLLWTGLPTVKTVLKVCDDDEAPRRFLTVRVDDVAIRFQPDDPSAPLWAAITVGRRQELCVLPSIGKIGNSRERRWVAGIVVDRAATKRVCRSAGYVESHAYTGLLGHLARRDFSRAAHVLGWLQSASPDVQGTSARLDVFNHYNPLAEVAAGLIFAATSPPERAPFDDRLERLADHYPELPDGPILVARRRWSLAKSDADRAGVVKLLRDGMARGVPVYSLCVDWLAQGLSALDEESAAARDALTLARRVDAGRCFTAIALEQAPS